MEDQDYEAERLRNIEENRKLLLSLGLELPNPNGASFSTEDIEVDEETIEARRIKREKFRAEREALIDGPRRRSSRPGLKAEGTYKLLRHKIHNGGGPSQRVIRARAKLVPTLFSNEIIETILRFVIETPSASSGSVPAATAVNVLLVSKRWYALGLRSFYKHVTISSSPGLLNFLGCKQGRRSKRVYLPLEYEGDREYWMASVEHRLKYVTSLKFDHRYCSSFRVSFEAEKIESTSLTQHASLNIQELLPNLQHLAISMIYHSTYESMMSIWNHLFGDYNPPGTFHIGLDLNNSPELIHAARATFIHQATSLELTSLYSPVQSILNDMISVLGDQSLADLSASSLLPAEFVNNRVTHIAVQHAHVDIWEDTPNTTNQPRKKVIDPAHASSTFTPADEVNLALMTRAYPSLRKLVVRDVVVKSCKITNTRGLRREDLEVDDAAYAPAVRKVVEVLHRTAVGGVVDVGDKLEIDWEDKDAKVAVEGANVEETEQEEIKVKEEIKEEGR